MIGGAEVRRLRPRLPPAQTKPAVPHALEERERLAGGRVVSSLTVFPVGAECPFACVYCDLWQHTLGPTATPPGSLPRQLRGAIAAASGEATQIKVYNASNFFEDRAVPPADDPALLELLAPYERVVVECHPRWLGERCWRFARSLPGTLQVAIGLETVHPEALPRLGKAMTVERFDRAVEELLAREIAVRAFVLVGAPFVPADETVEWAVRSVEHALARGVEHVALLPVRSGSGSGGALGELRRRGDWRPPTLAELERAFDASLALGLPGVVTVDLWDLADDLACHACQGCQEARRQRLARMNDSGRLEPPAACPAALDGTAGCPAP